MHATFLPTIGSLSRRYSLKEATLELGMSFLDQGRELKLYLMTTYIMDFYAKPDSTGFPGITTRYSTYFHTLVDFHAKPSFVGFTGIQNDTLVCRWAL